MLNKEMLAAAPGAWSIRLEKEAGVDDAALLQLDVGLYELLSYTAALPLVCIHLVITKLPPLLTRSPAFSFGNWRVTGRNYPLLSAPDNLPRD